MKKLILALSLLMLLPLPAMALQTMNDNDMGAITGQSGVSIAVDDIRIYQNIGYITYTDNDGTTGAPGAVSISNLYMMVNINAITHLTGGLPVSPGRAAMGSYHLTDMTGGPISYNNNVSGTAFEAKAITIDVGDLAVLSEGKSYNTTSGAAGTGISVVGVRIGLPTAEIYQTALSFDVTVSGGSPSTLIPGSTAAANSGASFGNISIGANTMTVLDGFVEIAAH